MSYQLTTASPVISMCYWRCGTALKSCQRQLGWHACPFLSNSGREETWSLVIAIGETSLRRPLSDSNLCSPRLQDKYNAGSVHERITSRKMLKVIQQGTQAQQVTQQAPSQSKMACQGLHVSIRDRPSVEFRACTGSNTKNWQSQSRSCGEVMLEREVHAVHAACSESLLILGLLSYPKYLELENVSTLRWIILILHKGRCDPLLHIAR